MNESKKYIWIVNLVLQEIQKLYAELLLQNYSRMNTLKSRIEQSLADIHRFGLAVQRNWMVAAERMQAQILRNFLDMSYEWQTVRNYLEKELPKLPTFADILAELHQLEEEYGQLRFNPEEKTLSVITDFIELEDVPLGSFEIRLHLLRLGELCKDSPYRTIALEPNPAGSDSSVTHPHVSGEHLCEGDGHLPIQKALAQGRLYDFFSIVVGILNTYCPDSPYVSLSDWDGFSCYDCGYTMSRDESYICEQCGNDFCSQCSTSCQICDITLCLGCAIECPGCRKAICPKCYSTCEECGEKLCKSCINENGVCELCEQERKEQEDEETNTDAA